MWRLPEHYAEPTADAAHELGYLPPRPDAESVCWLPVAVRHLVARARADGRGTQKWPLDTLFPATLTGRIDSSSIDEGTAAALYGLVRMLGPRVVLETGTHTGRGTRELARGLRDNAEWDVLPHSYTLQLEQGHCYTVDLHDYGLRTSGALLPGTDGYTTQIIGRTPGILSQPPLDTLTGIDFAFLDGDHTAEGLEAELIYLEHHRAAECWIAVDNSRDHGWPGVSRVLNDWAKKYPRVSFGSCTGLDVLWMR